MLNIKGQGAAVFHLPFFDHVHEFDAGEKNACAAKILEAKHRSGSTFNGTVVLLDDVVQVLDLAYDDPLPSSGIHGFKSGYIRATFIDGHFLWCSVLRTPEKILVDRKRYLSPSSVTLRSG